MVRTLCPRLLLVGLALVLFPSVAEAHRNGVSADGCGGCHNGGKVPAVTVTATPDPLQPAQLATVTVAIQAVNGSVGGLYIHPSKGTMSVIAGEGTRLEGAGIVHSAPKAAVGGFVTFHVGWTAPATPGGVDFYVSAVSANNDNSSRGDGGGDGFLTLTYGCTGMTFYRDFDGDTFGGDLSGYTRDCTKPMYFTDKAGDCNDNDAKIYPGAPELCDKRDNNCNGQIDEGLPIMAYYPDADGDGHGVPGTPVMDCAPPRGYGVGTDDCDDTKNFVYPGAPELCNYIDDNCNGRVDEGAQLTCGMGWCRRLGAGCNTNVCTPGAPRPEVCNAFDDDCDGVNDNGTDLQLCGAPGLKCVAGICVDAATVPDAGTGGATTGPGTGAAGVSGAGAGTGSAGDLGGGGAEPGTGGTIYNSRPQAGCSLVDDSARAPWLFAFAVLLLTLRARRRR